MQRNNTIHSNISKVFLCHLDISIVSGMNALDMMAVIQ